MFRAPLCPSSGTLQWLLPPVGILFPHINDDARSKSHKNVLLYFRKLVTDLFFSRQVLNNFKILRHVGIFIALFSSYVREEKIEESCFLIRDNSVGLVGGFYSPGQCRCRRQLDVRNEVVLIFMECRLPVDIRLRVYLFSY